LIVFFSVTFLFFTGCRLPEITREAPAINKVEKGTEFRINLPEDHTTGYTWQLSDGYDRKVIQRINEVWHGNAKGIDFNLKAAAVGQTTLTFVSRMHTDTGGYKKFIVVITDN
jgi:predicted secreted protein